MIERYKIDDSECGNIRKNRNKKVQILAKLKKQNLLKSKMFKFKNI